MKIILIVILFPVFLTAQVNDSLEFFPYHLGDIWQYIHIPEGNIVERKITKIDTVLLDSAMYIYYNNENSPFWKIKINNKKVIYWIPEPYLIEPYWIPFLRFDVPINSYWLIKNNNFEWIIYKAENNENIFGSDRTVKEFWRTSDTTSDLPYSSDKYVSGIGYYKTEYEGGGIQLLGCIVNDKQYGTIVSVNRKNNILLPNSFYLSTYPNPFNSQTNIVYDIPFGSNISIKVFDLIGRLVSIITEGHKNKGKYIEKWKPKKLSSGIYIAVHKCPNNILTTKLIYLK